jgi:hypothetical protein
MAAACWEIFAGAQALQDLHAAAVPSYLSPDLHVGPPLVNQALPWDYDLAGGHFYLANERTLLLVPTQNVTSA